MKTNPYNIILLLGSLIIIVFGIFKLFFSRKKEKTFTYFYAFLITANLAIIQVLLVDFKITSIYPWILLLFIPFQYLSPVFFTAFTCYYLEREDIYKKNQKYFLIPFITFFIVYTVFKINILLDYSIISKITTTFILNEIDENFTVIFCFLLSIMNYRIILGYEHSLGSLSFIYVRKKTKWIKNIFIALVILSVLWMLTIILFLIKKEISGHSPYYPIWSLYLIFCYVFLFIGKKHLDEIAGRVKNWKDPIQKKITDFQLSGLEHIFSERELQLIYENPTHFTGVLSYFATSLFDKNKMDDVLSNIAENCISQLELQECSIYMIDKKSERLIPTTIYSNTNNYETIKRKQKPSISLREGILGKVISSRKHQCVDIIPITGKNNITKGSKLTVPILIKDEVIGVLDSEHTQESYFKSHHITLFLLIARLIEIKLSQIKISTHSTVRNTITNDNVYFKELDVLMKKEKIYADPNLGLENISNRLNISSNYLSQLINKLSGCNFSDYINSYRIEEVKSKLKDPEYGNYTVLGIAMECGFNSKSPFYSAFKKHTGISPKEYRKQQQIIS
ncbi:helix-turn-helix domain-containing protein [Aquimarina sp. 2201CG5-10]|uniref:helix-turn-helix domain-containing protein n=1 Tax=Aquimarina callyspongiae TaxID=3098150 RepID=UPI002AB5B7BD|nr:helix-turn-helix domain-containing protein [Aquimarina sp. 2201CG5-10]MDY8135105.1 helix-turn-helix domain-containing protein [Aquimarina sp. 2201CG5-10]